MAAAKKYAGLPDLDIAAPEIYETPELTEGGSTAPTATIRTDSPSPSDAGDGDERLDHQRIDQESARRRFEPSLVDAKNVNFGDTVNADERISYTARSRRRRRRRRTHFGDSSDDESDEEESLGARIARLKREALEVRLELDRRNGEGEEGAAADGDGVEELGKLLADLNASSTQIGTRDRVERDFLRTLDRANQPFTKDSAGKPVLHPDREAAVSASPPTAAIADFADRLTALESALGLSTIDPTTPASAILPTLDSLSDQITTLSSIIAPPKGSSPTSSAPPPSLPNLDELQSRIHLLTAEADKLSASRKAALASLDELQEARLRYSTIRPKTHSRPTSSHNGPLQDLDRQESQLHSGLFLQEQASKITALYQLLPTIQGLQPLLPTVLERLRSLSVIHAGAAEARGELDDVIRRQAETREEIKKWRAAVESVEQKIADMSKDMKENVDVVGGLIGGVEERIKALGQESR